MRRVKVRRKGGKGNRKGGAFERKLCKLFSLWVSNGKRTDLFWRTSMSGGRATVMRKQGVIVRQSGDMCAVSPEGHAFTEAWYLEFKHYKSINLGAWLVNNQGPIVKWWKRAKAEARACGRHPMLIIRQNGWPILVITKPNYINRWATSILYSRKHDCDVVYFDDIMKSSYEDGKWYAHIQE